MVQPPKHTGLPQRLKSPLDRSTRKKIQKMLILVFELNSALSRQITRFPRFRSLWSWPTVLRAINNLFFEKYKPALEIIRKEQKCWVKYMGQIRLEI